MKWLAILLASLLVLLACWVAANGEGQFEEGVGYSSRYFLRPSAGVQVEGWRSIRFSDETFYFSYLENSSLGTGTGKMQGHIESQMGRFMVLSVESGSHQGQSDLTQLPGAENMYLDREYITTPGNLIHVVMLPRRYKGSICYYLVEFRSVECKSQY
ncbi:hypothetical protein JVX91_24270 [Pseudomonas sp. PDNC002]|uniref:hypothetical protein n=1 Tax=Pseudomonas sp. PDNC002 TaxID=2811422 RepID=UPI001962E8C5|nr:hypothetical protein [Pseudomonas sp. PDNC002]QRY78667.1 hypothetical protein JVX91_24270 [Pseudomonas sp. PDNC002]